jgi:hypothetical protein
MVFLTHFLRNVIRDDSRYNGQHLSHCVFIFRSNSRDIGGEQYQCIPVTVHATSARSSDDDGESCGGISSTLHALSFITAPNSSRTPTSVRVNVLGEPTSTTSYSSDPGLVLSKDATAPSGTQAGAGSRPDRQESLVARPGFSFHGSASTLPNGQRHVLVNKQPFSVYPTST